MSEFIRILPIPCELGAGYFKEECVARFDLMGNKYETFISDEFENNGNILLKILGENVDTFLVRIPGDLIKGDKEVRVNKRELSNTWFYQIQK